MNLIDSYYYYYLDTRMIDCFSRRASEKLRKRTETANEPVISGQHFSFLIGRMYVHT